MSLVEDPIGMGRKNLLKWKRVLDFAQEEAPASLLKDLLDIYEFAIETAISAEVLEHVRLQVPGLVDNVEADILSTRKKTS